MKKIERVSDPVHSTKISSKERVRSAPPAKGRHEQFQFGTNPMAMTEFEKSRVALEIEERKMAAEKYIKGIQGRDGGCKYAKDELISPLNPTRQL